MTDPQPPRGGTHNEFSGTADIVVQAGQIDGDVRIHQAPARPLPVPHQLPSDISHFTGRTDDLDQLSAALPDQHQSMAAPVVISAIAGTAGVGKTTLAVHWAHQVRNRFTDGELYLNLRGYAQGSRVEPAEALGSILRALDVPPDKIPPGLEERAGLYRSLMHGRRVLIVLDNAATAAQVRPLLPGSPECLVLVTSRGNLAGLDAVCRIMLDVLSFDNAVALLRKLISARRVDAEPDATAELAALCARLPLALRLAGARIATRPHSSIADFVGELSGDRLSALSTSDDPEGAVREVLSWSYRALLSEAPDSARMFRVLGLHAGPEISVPAAAALANTTPNRARALLESLVDVHLLDAAGGRYQFHDLLRLYAVERAQDEEPQQDRTDAVRRVLAWYLHTADAADRVVLPQRRHVPLDTPVAPAPLAFTSRSQALDWCQTERANLVAATRHAEQAGEDVIAWKLPAALWGYFHQRKPWDDWITTHRIGLAAAQRLEDRYGQAWILSSVGIAHREQHNYTEALDCLTRAATLCRDIGDSYGQAWARNSLGNAHREIGWFDDAIEQSTQALALWQEIGDRYGQAITLNSLSGIYRELGQFDDALACSQQAVAAFADIGDQHGHSWALNNLADTHRKLGHLTKATTLYQQVLDVRAQIGDLYGQAFTLKSLGAVLRDTGHTDAAREAWRQALNIFDELGDPLTDEIRTHLDTLDRQNPDPHP